MRIIGITFAAILYSMPLYAKNDDMKIADQDLKVQEAVSSVERWRWLPWKLNSALMQLDSEVSKGGVSDKALREMTTSLVKVYYSLSDVMMSIANKKRIIELVGADNGPEAHEFFLKVLSDKNTEYRDMALRCIYPKGIHGDDLYEKIKNLENAKAFSKAESLMYLKLANPTRALIEIQDFLRTTQNVNDFVMVSLNVSTFYDDPSCLDVVFDRYPDFRKKQGGESPSSAVAWSSLRKYLEAAEGERFGGAMQVFADQGIFEPAARNILYKKMKSANLLTREVAVEYVIDHTGDTTIPSRELLEAIESAYAKETNARVKVKLGKAAESVRRREKGK